MACDMLTEGVDYEQVEHLRQGSPIVDFGNVTPDRLESCRADYAILTYYDLYRAEAAAFPKENRNYEKLLAGGRTVALFEPQPRPGRRATRQGGEAAATLIWFIEARVAGLGSHR